MNLAELEYPRYVHLPSRWGEWIMLRVENEKACAAALEDGWSLTASLIEPAAEVSEAIIEPPPVKRGPGRPPKVRP
jgi:hypothetical protein